MKIYLLTFLFVDKKWHVTHKKIVNINYKFSLSLKAFMSVSLDQPPLKLVQLNDIWFDFL